MYLIIQTMTSIVTDTSKNISTQCDFNYKEIRRLDPYEYDGVKQLGKCYVSKPSDPFGKVKVGIVYERKKRGAKDDWGDDIYEKRFSWLNELPKKAWIDYRREIIGEFESSLSLLNKPLHYGSYMKDETNKFIESAFEYNNRIYYQKKYNEEIKKGERIKRERKKEKEHLKKVEDLVHKLKKVEKTQKKLIEHLRKCKNDDDCDLNNMADALTGMFKKYTNLESRQEWANNEKLRETGLEHYLCVDCGTFELYEPNVNTKKCIHNDCPGMCSGCFDIKNPEGFEVCSCCNKKQEFECPICYTTRSSEFIVKGKNCSHSICCICYTKAIRGGNKIDNCPMCRKEF